MTFKDPLILRWGENYKKNKKQYPAYKNISEKEYCHLKGRCCDICGAFPDERRGSSLMRINLKDPNYTWSNCISACGGCVAQRTKHRDLPLAEYIVKRGFKVPEKVEEYERKRNSQTLSPAVLGLYTGFERAIPVK